MKNPIIKVIIMIIINVQIFAHTISIATQKDIYDDYIKFLAGRNPLEIKYYGGKHSRRDVVEMVLILQALKYGGFNKPVKFIVSPSYKNDLQMIFSGAIVARAASVWSNDAIQHKGLINMTIPVIDLGEFEAGFYTVENNNLALEAKSLEDINKFSIISSRNWSVDWNTLNQLKLQNLHHVARWPEMVMAVKEKKIDYLLAPFQPTNDLSFTIDNTKFIPVPNIKIGLMATRHYIVSKKHPDGKEFYKALNIGIKIMKEKGLIRKIYIESGFFNNKVKNWRKIN